MVYIVNIWQFADGGIAFSSPGSKLDKLYFDSPSVRLGYTEIEIPPPVYKGEVDGKIVGSEINYIFSSGKRATIIHAILPADAHNVKVSYDTKDKP